MSIACNAYSLADLQFHSGDFKGACAHYQDELSSLESTKSDARELAVLLQKLGDSCYASGDNLQARDTYERLLSLQREYGFPGKDLVFTHLKLAKACDLCDNQAAAQEQFIMAYDLAKLHLPSENFVRRSLCASYSASLARSGSDPNMLAVLQTELGKSATPDKLADMDFAPQSQEDRIPMQCPAVADFSDMKKRLDRQSRKKSSRKKSAKKAVSSYFLYPDDSEFDFLSDHPVTVDAKPRPQLLPQPQPQPPPQSEHLPELDLLWHASNEINKPTRTVFKDRFGVRAQRIFRLLETPLSRKAENKTDYPQYEALKKQLISHVPTLSIVLASLIICKLMLFCPDVSGTTLLYRSLMGKRLATVDGALSIKVDSKGLILREKGVEKTTRLSLWRGSFLNDMRLLTGGYNNCIWLTPSEHGLQDQNGGQFFDPSAPEAMTVSTINKVADQAQRFYCITGHYPGPNDFQQNQYLNVCNSCSEQVSMHSMFLGEGGLNRLQKYLEYGQLFDNETPRTPGRVSAFCIQCQNATAQALPEYQCLYLHGFDRDGKLIKSFDPDKTFVVTLRKGVTVSTDTAPAMHKYSGANFALSAQRPPEYASVLLKYLIGLLVIYAFFLLITWSQKEISEI